jgi:hypothetical protein
MQAAKSPGHRLPSPVGSPVWSVSLPLSSRISPVSICASGPDYKSTEVSESAFKSIPRLLVFMVFLKHGSEPRCEVTRRFLMAFGVPFLLEWTPHEPERGNRLISPLDPNICKERRCLSQIMGQPQSDLRSWARPCLFSS